MARAFGILIVVAASYAATLTDDRVAEVVKRLEVLSAKESARPRQDTRQRMSQLLRGIQDTGNIAPHRCPATPDVSADALTLIRILNVNDQHAALIDMLNCADASHLDRAILEPFARQFLYVVEHTNEAPEDYNRLSSLRRKYELSVGGDNASVRARDALAELAALTSTDYDFTLPSLNGQTVTLTQQRGKVVVLTFWASWCAPCISEMPLFEKLYREHRSSNFELLAISDEPAADVQAFMKENGYTFPVVLDPGRTVFDHYHVPGMPATRILDKSGRLRAEAGAITEAELKHLLPVVGLPAPATQLE